MASLTVQTGVDLWSSDTFDDMARWKGRILFACTACLYLATSRLEPLKQFEVTTEKSPTTSDGSPYNEEDKVIFDGQHFVNRYDRVKAPKPKPGSPWPMPQQYLTTPARFTLHSHNMKIVATLKHCEILSYNIRRAWMTIFGSERGLEEALRESDWADNDGVRLLIVTKFCPNNLSPGSIEKYDLIVRRGSLHVSSDEVWGAVRGLETLSQLTYKDSEGKVWINQTTIRDWPRFPHRGIMLDTARHYLTVDTIITNLEAMAMNKMNIFHWHIVDRESFPFFSKTFPNLTRYGAYSTNEVYTHEMIAQVIEEARLRGIRVIPEFDTPDHTDSWGLGIKDLLTPCYSPQNGEPDGTFGPFNPIGNTTYAFIEEFFKEVLQIFPDEYIHLGGDEIDGKCWISNKEIQRFMNDHNMMVTRDLKGFYFSRLTKILKRLESPHHNMAPRRIVWEDVFDDHIPLPQDTVIQLWKSGYSYANKVNLAGHKVIISSCWYLDKVKNDIEWTEYYLCADGEYKGLSHLMNESNVLGGEACMWTEYVDDSEVINRLWPKASAAAERLWSSADTVDINEAGPRIEEQRCRMIRRGLKVGVLSGPGFCADGHKGRSDLLPRDKGTATLIMEEDHKRELNEYVAGFSKYLKEDGHGNYVLNI